MKGDQAAVITVWVMGAILWRYEWQTAFGWLMTAKQTAHLQLGKLLVGNCALMLAYDVLVAFFASRIIRRMMKSNICQSMLRAYQLPLCCNGVRRDFGFGDNSNGIIGNQTLTVAYRSLNTLMTTGKVFSSTCVLRCAGMRASGLAEY